MRTRRFDLNSVACHHLRARLRTAWMNGRLGGACHRYSGCGSGNDSRVSVRHLDRIRGLRCHLVRQLVYLLLWQTVEVWLRVLLATHSAVRILPLDTCWRCTCLSNLVVLLDAVGCLSETLLTCI